MELIDSLLNKVTMYRLTLYYLIVLILISILFGFFHFLPFSPLDIIISSLILVVVCFASNFLLAKLFNAITNVESVFITALILALIIPLSFPTNLKFLIEASVFAMGVKYLLTVEKRHLFNPAAAAVVIIALLTNNSATWWVGTPIMLPFVFIGGLLLVRKIRREKLVFSFLIVYLLVLTIGSLLHSASLISVLTTWKLSVLDSALFFFTFVMLTEPMTSPTTNKLQGYYGYLVAILYATPQLRLISFGFTPEMALIIGNVFSYFISSNYRLDLSLKWKKQLSPDTYAFAFDRTPDFKFIPGQYMEWTLPHKNTDSRGNRRYFSIASSPTESDIFMTVKFYDPSSTYKKELLGIMQGNKIIASQLAGDFTLPKDLKKPLVFVAGGVGIAPFRSMIKYITDKNLSVNIVLFYSNRTANEILFIDTLNTAVANGVKTIFTLTDKDNIPQSWSGKVGYITQEMIAEEMPDYKNRTYYISGPQLMVQNFEKTLKSLHISRRQIITDFFPGYVEKV